MIAEPKIADAALRTPLHRSREEDIRLAALAAAGDREAERQVAQMLLEKVRNIIAYAVNDPSFADDLSQSAMLKILSSLSRYRGESSLSFWATKIAVRMAIKAVRTQRRRRQLLFFLPEPTAPFEDSHKAVSGQELRRQINRLVSKLSVKHQTVIRLRYVHEFSIREIAEITDVPENTVRDRLRVGKKRLKSLIDKNPEVKGWIFRGKP